MHTLPRLRRLADFVDKKLTALALFSLLGQTLSMHIQEVIADNARIVHMHPGRCVHLRDLASFNSTVHRIYSMR